MNTLNYPTGSDNVERRDSDPHAYSRQFDPGPDMYEHHINDACRAIQQTPFSLVTNSYIHHVLSALESKAMEANLVELADKVGCVAAEIEE